ncbi:MAG: FAD-binding oxidoreductase [Acetobacteraceae bacterium]|nr:FAD-binding oxidoreductase [Acetobacteraceae bacterium]
MTERNLDVAIVGGGVIGSATAFFLRELGYTGSVTVFEKDPSYQFASTARSAASIRQQFTTPVSTRMSQFSFGFLEQLGERFGPDGEIALHRGAYLLLADKAREAMLRSCHETFVRLGAAIAWLDQDALAARFPWLRTDDLVGGTLGLAGEGWFDAYMLLRVLRRQARALGVTYVDKEVVSFEREGGRITGLCCADGEAFGCGIVVNAAGPAAGRVAALAGCALPVEPRKRTMFVIQAPLDGNGMPFVFDTSGVALRPEGDRFICSALPAEERDPHPGDDYEPDHYLFEEAVWPALAHRVPALEQLRLQSAWAGHYDMNLFDHNGVVGFHPEVSNLIFANGFSGHGVMHAPATGRGVAELVLHGRYVSLDLGPLGYGRIAAGEPIVEALVY